MHRRFNFWMATLLGLLVFGTHGFAQDSLHVRRVSEIVNPGAAFDHGGWDVALDNNRAYICSWGYGLWVVDVSDEDSLMDLGAYNPPC